MKYNMTAAVVGSGHNGVMHIASYKKLGLNIVVCSTDVQTGMSVADEYGAKFYGDYKEMFAKEKIDLVSVCVPTFLHYDVTMTALESGVNVLCEKPFSLDSKEAKAMIDKAEEKGLLLMVGHCLRFGQPFEYLRRCVEDLRFGKLVYFEQFRHGSAPKWGVDNWFANPLLSGGSLRDMHIHATDMVINILGVPEDVYTSGNQFASSTVYKFATPNLSVTASSSWRNAKGCPSQSGFDAIFEKGNVILRGTDFAAYDTNGKVENALENEDFGEFYAPIGAVNIEYETAYFCHCLANGIKPQICPVEQSLAAVIINEKEYACVKQQ